MTYCSRHQRPESRPVIIIYILLFLILLVLTALTPMVSDDYAYSFNWADWTRIESLSDIWESMAVHRATHNGRVFAHGTVQLLLFLPRIVYCIINSFSGVLLCVLSRKLIQTRPWQDTVAILLFGIFFVACFTTAIGEDYLWLDGSINYSWSVTLSFLFLLPFFLEYLGNSPAPSKLSVALRCFLAFWVGGYAESSSLIVLTLAGFLLIANGIGKKKWNKTFLIWLIFGVIGYIYLMSAPSTTDLASSFSFSVLGYNFREIFRIAHDDLIGAYLIFAVLFTLAIWFKTNRNHIMLAFLLFLCGILSLASYVLAAYIEPRHLCFPVFFTMLACLLLLSSLSMAGKAIFSRLTLACFSVLFLLQFPVGVLDVAVSWHKQQVRLQMIHQALNAGKTSVILENYYPYTSYGVRFVMNTENPSYGPNVNIADYYGLEEVYGVDP